MASSAEIPVNRPHIEENFKCRILKEFRNVGLWYNTFTGLRWSANISVICYFIMYATQMIIMIQSRENLVALLASLGYISFYFVGILKLICLTAKKKQWQFLINLTENLENDQLNNHDVALDYDSDDEENNASIFFQHISNYTKQFHWITKYVTIFYSITVSIFLTVPLIFFGLCLYQGKSVGYVHTMPIWTPLDFSVIGYIVTVVVEILSSLFCVKVHQVFDLTVVGLMICVRGQFGLIHDYSESIGGRGEKLCLSKRRDKRAQFRIKTCHNIHIMLLLSVDKLGKLIQNIFGVYFLLSTLILCSVLVQIQSQNLTIAQLIPLVQYMGANLIQLYMFCYYGDGILNKSCVSLGEGPFCAASWCLSPKIRRQIAILGVGMSQQRRVMAGPFNSLDLLSFIQIVRAGYGYYAFLRQQN